MSTTIYRRQETEEMKCKLGKVREISQRLMPKLAYHNSRHVEDVYTAVSVLSNMERISVEERFLLKTAALLHDIILVPGNKDNEERSVEFAEIYLPKAEFGYSVNQIDLISNMILATKMPQKPIDLFGRIICDADLDNLGRPDFFDLGEKVREELNIPGGEKWQRGQLGFLKGHSYWTESAKKLRDSGKAENIEKLEYLLGLKTKTY